MKILAVGMNYAKHNKELDGTLYKPEEPVIFAKPDSALLKDGKPFFIPDFTKQCDYETELVIRICRLGKNIAPRFAYRYYDAVTVGIDFTTRHDIWLIEMLWQEWTVRMLCKTRCHNPQRLVVIDSKEVHGVLANEFQLLRCIIWQQIMLRQNLH